MTEAPKAGDVLRYPYLWARQARNGETEGRKPRPCAVVLTVATQANKTELRLCAITTQQPTSDVVALLIPETEKRRAGLDVRLQLWVILDEHNFDVFEQSYYIEPLSQVGIFSRVFTKELQQKMIIAIQQRHSRTIHRSD